jgi:hypothetical protein
VDRRRVPSINSVAFIALIALVCAAVIVHADGQHHANRAVRVDPVPSDGSTPSGSPSVLATPTGSASIPTPAPRTLSVGQALCTSTDYALHLQTVTTAVTTTYNVTATATSGSCLLIDYPDVTVRQSAKSAARRDLGPAGGYVRGYGQAPQIKLSPAKPVMSYLEVDGKDCATETFRDVRLAGVALVDRIAGWCDLRELPWSYVGRDAHGGSSTGEQRCRQYDLKVSPHVSQTTVAKGTRYTMRVTNKTGSSCLLDTFPPLAATASDGHLRELTVGATGPLPSLELSGEASVTAYVLELGSTCSHETLRGLKLENNDVRVGGKPLDFRSWCSLTESYWQR